MSRNPLIHIPDGLYSVVSKCNNNEFLFDASAKFDLYLKHLLFCKKKLGFKLYDIVCMSNHVHELYRVPSNGVTIADILHTVKGHFSQRFNAAFGRSGHFWRNKPRYRIVENEEYAVNSCNYFHWNPVRAGLVNHPSEWPYSGYRFHVLGQTNGLLGELLDPIPGYEDKLKMFDRPPEAHSNLMKLLQKRHSRFIGCEPFVEKMLTQFGQHSSR